jgi:hypothetical protein
VTTRTVAALLVLGCRAQVVAKFEIDELEACGPRSLQVIDPAYVAPSSTAQQPNFSASNVVNPGAPYRPVLLLPAADLRDADATHENADEDDNQEDDELDESSAFQPMLDMLEPHLPQLGAFLYTKCIEFFRQVPRRPRRRRLP